MDIKQKAFEHFDNMKPGQVIIITEFAKVDPMAFTRYGFAYIQSGGNMEFSGDYSRLRKVSGVEDYKKI